MYGEPWYHASKYSSLWLCTENRDIMHGNTQWNYLYRLYRYRYIEVIYESWAMREGMRGWEGTDDREQQIKVALMIDV